MSYIAQQKSNLKNHGHVGMEVDKQEWYIRVMDYELNKITFFSCGS